MAEPADPDAAPPPEAGAKLCIYPGCQRPAVPAHPLGGPQPAFCDLDEHNALSTHLERQRLAAAAADSEESDHEQ